MNSYANWEDNQVVYTLTAVIKIHLLAMPSSGFSNLMRFMGRRSVGLGVTSTGQLVCSYKNPTGWSIGYSTSQDLTIGQDAFVRFTYSRSDTAN